MRIVGFGQDGDLNLTSVIIEDDGREYWFENPRWISVEERLPEKGQKVAFIPNCNPRSVYVGEISHVGRQGGVMFENSFSRTTMKYYATHWMPLPEPPKEE